MTREELDFIGSMNMCDEISNEAYKKIVCHCGEQEPCEDAISRQDALDLAKKGVLISNGNYESVCKAINELPPVSPQAKTGHWIKWYEKVEYKDWTDYMLYCKCSECGKQYDPHLSQFIQYCSKCGTRMVEPQESEDKTE